MTSSKSFHPDLKLSGSGELRSTIATLEVIDKDKDVTLPGFFGEQNVSILVSHDWGEIPVGKGTIREEGKEAVLDGKLNLDSPDGKAVHSWLKFDLDHGDPLQEWSYGFTLKPDGFRFGEFEGEPVRFLIPTPSGDPGAKIHEASLVIVGAGEGTRTLSVKGAGSKIGIPSHSTEVLDRAWSGPRAEAAIPDDASPSKLRLMYAWRDPDGDPAAKSSYRFIHHSWKDGPGPANLRAAISGIAVLNGARGGTTIPDEEKRSVWNHLARHIRDSGVEPPELRSGDLSDAEVKYWEVLASLADPTESKLSEHVDYVLERTAELRARVKSLADLREQDGRKLSEETVEKIEGLRDELSEILDPPSEPTVELPSSDEMDLLLAQTEARLHGRTLV